MTFYDILNAIGAHRSSVIDLSTGDPLVPTDVADAIVDIVSSLSTRPDIRFLVTSYAQLDGHPDLRREAATALTDAFGRRVAEEELLIVPGCQMALNLIRMVAAAEGRCAVWPAPFEFPGAVFADLDGGAAPARPLRCLDLENGYIGYDLDLTDFVAPERSFAFLSNPHNPTGAIWPTETVRELSQRCSAADGRLILDKTYAFPWAPMAQSTLDPFDLPSVVHLVSFSKVGLAGERLGLVVADATFIRQLSGALRRAIIQSPKIAQILGARLIRLYRENQALADSVGSVFSENWRMAAAVLEAVVPGGRFRITHWGGGPFLWLEWEDPGIDDVLLFKRALERGVAVMPASVLRTPRTMARPNALRVGLGLEHEQLLTGIERLAESLR
jgi:valine--pyruvate aminotransferase